MPGTLLQARHQQLGQAVAGGSLLILPGFAQHGAHVDESQGLGHSLPCTCAAELPEGGTISQAHFLYETWTLPEHEPDECQSIGCSTAQHNAGLPVEAPAGEGGASRSIVPSLDKE